MIGISAWKRPVDWLLGRAQPMYTLTTDYAERLGAAGGLPVILPPGRPEAAPAAVARLDGLVISGGGDIDPACYGAKNTESHDIDPDRDAWEIALVRAAREAGVPTLGICRGLQVMAVALGGSLHQHVWKEGTDHPPLEAGDGPYLERPHRVAFSEGSRLRALFGTERTVNSYHHQAADRIPPGFEVTGRSPDGTTEAIEATGSWPALAVQWHPERDEGDDPLFEYFVRLSAERAVVAGDRL